MMAYPRSIVFSVQSLLLPVIALVGCAASTPTPVLPPTPTPILLPQATVRTFIEAVLAGRTEEAADQVCGDIKVLPIPVRATYQLALVDNDDRLAHVRVVGDATVTVIITFKKHLDFTLAVRWSGARWCIDETSFRAFWKALTTPGGVAD